jgi:hypothetical protein
MRNETLNRAAFNLGQIIGAGELAEQEVTSRLMYAAQRCGLPSREALATIKSGVTAGRKKPRDYVGGSQFKPEYCRSFSRSQESRESQESHVTEKPKPLRREQPPSEKYPVGALGNILSGAAKGIIDKIQCPDAIAGSSVLAAGSYVAQAHADVILSYSGCVRPTSLFMVSVAASGDRKSAADGEAIKPIRTREKELSEIYDMEIRDYRRAKRVYDGEIAAAEKLKSRDDVERALLAAGEEPKAPLIPILTTDEPTVEGLFKLYEKGHRSLGLFSDEGGGLMGGHAFQKENKLKSITSLSSLWDGAPLRRIRAGDGASVLHGCRLAVHLMMQVSASTLLLADPTAKDQGILSRMLVCQPESLAGSRFIKPTSPETQPAIDKYNLTLLDLLRRPARYLSGTSNGLDPRGLPFSQQAARSMERLVDEIERKLGDGQPYERIRGFANKIPENIARIASVITIIDNPDASQISQENLARATVLGQFYAAEALRLFEASHVPQEIVEAERLLAWLQTSWNEPLIALVPIYQRGPNSIRIATTAKRAISILEEHGWLIRLEGSKHKVDGKVVREAWRIWRDEE